MPHLFNAVLKVRTCKGGLSESLAFHKWEGYTLQQLTKWDWYFRYRAALYQIKYPKADVQLNTFKYEADGEKLDRALRNRWIAKKRKITEWTNKIARAEESYDELFPIEEHQVYITAVAKLTRLQKEFVELNEIYMNSLIK